MMEKCFDEGTLQAFLDNELALEMSQKVARHVADCDLCAVTLAEVEEETAFAFTALEQEFNTLVPTQRLWTKINESIESQNRNRSVWQHILTFVSGFNLLNPQIVAFGSLLLIVGVVAVLLSVKPDENSIDVAKTNETKPQSVSKVSTSQPQNTPDTVIPPIVDKAVEPENRTPQYRVEKTNFVQRENNRKQNNVRQNPLNTGDAKSPVAPEYLPGEESYINTIARLEKTVNDNKDEVLKPSQRFSYEKDMAVVNDSIKKMQQEVKKNPRNDGAKEVLFASYQNKIELLNSVTERKELMASLR